MSNFHNFSCKSFCVNCVGDEGKKPNKQTPELYCVPWKDTWLMFSMGERAGGESQWKIGSRNVLPSASEWYVELAVIYIVLVQNSSMYGQANSQRFYSFSVELWDKQLVPKYVCVYTAIFLYNWDCGLFCIAIGRMYYLFIVLEMASKILHVNSYHWGRNFFVQKVIFYTYVYTYTHTCDLSTTDRGGLTYIVLK